MVRYRRGSPSYDPETKAFLAETEEQFDRLVAKYRDGYHGQIAMTPWQDSFSEAADGGILFTVTDATGKLVAWTGTEFDSSMHGYEENQEAEAVRWAASTLSIMKSEEWLS